MPRLTDFERLHWDCEGEVIEAMFGLAWLGTCDRSSCIEYFAEVDFVALRFPLAGEGQEILHHTMRPLRLLEQLGHKVGGARFQLGRGGQGRPRHQNNLVEIRDPPRADKTLGARPKHQDRQERRHQHYW